ncbi:MAG: insulinase family protein [bacterium]
MAYHAQFIRPDGATLIVVGDTTLDAIKPAVEKAFGEWTATTPRKTLSVSTVTSPKPKVLLIDKPGAEQSFIVAGNIFGARKDNDPIAAEAMNQIIGGSFMSRINMNLREDKHWSYGSRSFLFDTRNQQVYAVYAQVQSDKTKESILEVQKELNGYLSTNPATEEELARVKSNTARKIPGQNETTGRLLNSVEEIVVFGLPDDYYNTYVERVESLDTATVAAAAKTIIQPQNMVWIVVGDLSKIEAGVRELNLAADVEVIQQ